MMLKCMHTPATTRRAVRLHRTSARTFTQCGHQVAATARCRRRMYTCYAAATPPPQPDVEAQADKEDAEQDSAPTPPATEEAKPSPIELLKAWVHDEDLEGTDLEANVKDVAAELDFCRERLAAADQQYQALEMTATNAKDQFVRLTADFENFRRRTTEEKQRISSSVKGDVVLELLPLLDNFELARTQVKAETEGEQRINNSYQGLYKQMVEIVKSLGVEPVDTVGSVFDPEKHEAIMRQPNDEVPDGTVLMEFRKGFVLGDRLLRPAMVQVSYQEGTPEPSKAEE